MSPAYDEISELMALKRDAEKRRPRSQEAAAKKKTAKPPASGEPQESESAPEQETVDETEDKRPDLNKQMQELAEFVEKAVREIENTAEKQPVMVSLVAFTLGLVVGQSLSRR